jgi:hypothetical protein
MRKPATICGDGSGSSGTGSRGNHISKREENLMTSSVTANHEPNGVVAWRRTQLLRSGFTEEAAAGVAEDDRYDLHRLVELVERGCPPELALRILAPLD